MQILDIIQNKIILIPLIAVIAAQLIKIIIILIKQKNINFNQAIWSVGMPSSHSAFFSALILAVAIKEGINSSLFAITLLFSLVYLFDLILVFKVTKEKIKQLKGKLGHSFSEIIVGIIIGVAVALLLI
jgi:acid phosphatase family membrane protein YuiD